MQGVISNFTTNLFKFSIFLLGFNAAVAGCFFAIETVLRPLRAENSPPFTTAMIILASVISSTVSNVLLGEKPAFIVPTYELKSAAGILSHSGILFYI
jgi:H+/Cl- antiporter ClcA